MDLPAIQQELQKQNLEGWLFVDFQGSDPIAYSILGLSPVLHATRRWYYFIPSQGQPLKLLHRIEEHLLADLPGAVRTYGTWHELHSELQALLKTCRRVAMQYSPLNAVPTIGRVDAGTLELVQASAVTVVSSENLVSRFAAICSDTEYASHSEAGQLVEMVVDDTIAQLGALLAKGATITEFELQQYMLDCYRARGLTSDHPPIVATDSNSANPHYAPQEGTAATIGENQLVLIDTWARLDTAHSVYYDVTRMFYTGAVVPAEIAAVFNVVRSARDTALEYVAANFSSGILLRGCDVDDVARDVITRAGYGENFIHRTGHSIYHEVHGPGANLDNFETHDTRELLPGSLFSIEPGIYLSGRFGIRSEIDVFLDKTTAVVSGASPQNEVALVPL